ncbi:hypothetical protein A2W39_01490 [Candidatus Azambacteria bacterium RIFCSPHIGHO2_01_46_10]|uniref:GTPase Obg n=11 Tax=Candidatus Azamiibacteriota TaxID=1752741 RepID=A0A1F5C8D2_9BACT|nr:MAG: hypothetical protein A2W60_02135 [Candidatus Azambacteria bacterium RIFCSPHIGHO2_02_46_12]OGD35218.1 MAG: hypothetical protein A2W39_01490 [Candidatus Azambacteria bacterium RIFCSPHIGHO2_01_46_10]OGD39127.1 MAG: hypothetical protein A3A25_02365 [Candidatus Azambacteria bacterium RIFCSPLOWO2_01_FULL_46_26]OGD44134.1 MAG: hypothetical protein A3J02_03045 [Candidatus Azambacteria bacterium RIFCSPLOWO2_02_FULL_46_11]
MLIDDITIKIKAGDGGRGAVAFNKNKMSLGPVGGDGGNGGSVYFEGVSDLSALAQFRYKKDIKAKDGANGKRQFNDGPDGDDLVLKVPVGTVIHNFDGSASLTINPEQSRRIETGKIEEIIKIGQRISVARGGRGGKGNFKFRSSTNTSPRQFQFGAPGESFNIRLELKLIADIGLIGLPNAGKSSLLNELTKAKSKVASYPFTTLEPNLGVYYELILADIPGLIEGASAGKGLGVKFLRHVERTKILFHLISAESENPEKDYGIIKKELEHYSKELAEKTEYVFLSKSDVVPAEEIKKKITALKKIHKNVFAVSVCNWDSLEKVKSILNKIKAKK